jgi:exodeoxyribonuclease VII large subunit
MAAGGSLEHPWSVAEVNACVNQLLATSLPPAFFIQGEISNFRTYDRGHAFFTLKEPGAELPCVLWKDTLSRLKFKAKDGLAVIARGSIKLYEAQGRLQLYVEALYPQGAGALELAFRQLCDKLRGEGLFEQARKRPIPSLPQHIVIITSRTGDVLHDVLTTAFRRYPGLHVSLFPSPVQGPEAAPAMIRAIKAVNKYHHSLINAARAEPEARRGIDLILLVRGGGSLEDLWAFNDEALARAMVASAIPIATGIGHEPDTTIADLVGDLRGPTPTGITELTIPDVAALCTDIRNRGALLTRDIRRLVDLSARSLERSELHLTSTVRDTLHHHSARLDHLRRQIESIEPRHAIAQGWRRLEDASRRLDRAFRDKSSIPRRRDRLEHLRSRLDTALLAKTSAHRQQLSALAAHLHAVSPQAILERGFSITTDPSGAVIRSASSVRKGDHITTRTADGSFDSTVGKPRQSSLF